MPKSRGSQLQTKHLIGVVVSEMCLFSLYLLNSRYSLHEMLYGRIGVTFVYNFALRKYYFRDQ